MSMFTTDEVQQLGALLEPIKKKLESVATKQDVQEIVEGNNRILSTLLKVEITAKSQEMVKAVKKWFQETANQMKQLSKKLADHRHYIRQVEQDHKFSPT